MRTFVLQQVPLKTTAEMSLAFGGALLAVTLVGTAMGVAGAADVLKRSSR
jgi:hypothetical protein